MTTEVLIEDALFGRDDRIFLGEGLFETLRVSNAKVKNALLHWQRLSHSANRIGICFDVSFNAWQGLLDERIQTDKLINGGIKAILSGGSAPRGLTQRSENTQLLFQTFQYSTNNDPIRLISASWQRDGANPVYQVKSVNYLEAILARKEALAKGADDALFFNLSYHATETTCANFFIIQNNELFTPNLTDGVLPGVTRTQIFSICEQQNIACQELALTKNKIAQADAVFITNSLHGIKLVQSLDELSFTDTHPLIADLNLRLIEQI